MIISQFSLFEADIRKFVCDLLNFDMMLFFYSSSTNLLFSLCKSFFRCFAMKMRVVLGIIFLFKSHANDVVIKLS